MCNKRLKGKCARLVWKRWKRLNLKFHSWNIEMLPNSANERSRIKCDQFRSIQMAYKSAQFVPLILTNRNNRMQDYKSKWSELNHYGIDFCFLYRQKIIFIHHWNDLPHRNSLEFLEQCSPAPSATSRVCSAIRDECVPRFHRKTKEKSRIHTNVSTKLHNFVPFFVCTLERSEYLRTLDLSLLYMVLELGMHSWFVNTIWCSFFSVFHFSSEKNHVPFNQTRSGKRNNTTTSGKKTKQNQKQNKNITDERRTHTGSLARSLTTITIVINMHHVC